MARSNDSSQMKECLCHQDPKEERDRDGDLDREKERVRERERNRERELDRDHERERDRERELERARELERERERERELDREKERDRERDTNRNADYAKYGWNCLSSKSPGFSGSGDRGAFGGAEGGRLAKTSWGDEPSSCCSLKDLKTISQCEDKLGHLKFSPTHAVLVDVDKFNGRGELVAQHGRDMWNRDFVKLPSSQSSMVTVKTGPFTTKTVARWRTIQHHLTPLSQKQAASVADVAEAIMKYNPKYKTQWSFNALTTVVQRVPETDNYYRTLFPKIAALALKLPHHVQKAIPLLQQGHAVSITLSQAQISCLLANAFFCTFPHRNTTDPRAEYHKYPSINFNSLFGDGHDRKNEKLRAILHYFKEVTDRKPQGLVTFERRVLKDTDVNHWKHCKEKMPKLYVSSEGSIENEGTDLLQVDFASCWIGGGVLSSGLVQEEILFSINPELIVSRLFTEKLEHNECLIITGSQQFSSYSGYGDEFEWSGPHQDRVGRDKWGRLQRQILAIDALNLKQKKDQYNMMSITRELNKAYCGFKGTGRDEPDIATGKWGCGAFNGDPQLKAVIQLMAAARARRGLAFFTFKDYTLAHQLAQVHHLLVTEGTTVDQLFGVLSDFCAVQQASGAQIDLFEFIRNSVGPSKSLL